MPRKIPMRTCIGCGACQDKKTMVRIAHSKEGALVVDATGRAGGRGAYLCRNPECLEMAFRRKALARAFHAELAREDVEKTAAELAALMSSSEDAQRQGGAQ